MESGAELIVFGLEEQEMAMGHAKYGVDKFYSVAPKSQCGNT